MASESSESPAPQIVWNEAAGRFETEDKAAYLQYQIRDVPSGGSGGGGSGLEKGEDGASVLRVMDMVHTYVPRSKRGGGIASRLCDAAFRHASERGMPVIPTCSYISDTFLPRNPTWSVIVYGCGEKELPKSSM